MVEHEIKYESVSNHVSIPNIMISIIIDNKLQNIMWSAEDVSSPHSQL